MATGSSSVIASEGDGGGEREGDDPRGRCLNNEGRLRGDGRHPENRFSYKDKLLSLGDSGFLKTNMYAVDALNGWRDYFAKMCETTLPKSNGDTEGREGSNKEERESWRKTGKFPSLNIMGKSLIVKLIGKSFGEGLMRQRMERIWNPKKPIQIMPLSNGYFIVSFSTPEDRDYALQEGPWMIAYHYLLVQRWRLNFNPWKADTQKRIAAWIRIPDLPAKLYSIESLRRLGNLVGKTLKIDRTTAFSDKGGFARICVKLDLEQPLLPAFDHFGENRKIEYEGLHLICFHYGTYGHHMEKFPSKREEQMVKDKEANNTGSSSATNLGSSLEENSGKVSVEGDDGQVQQGSCDFAGGIYGPQMIVKRDFSKKKIKGDVKGVNEDSMTRKSISIQNESHCDSVTRSNKAKAKMDI